MLTLTSRYYRSIPIDSTSYVEETQKLDPARTALIGMHCWNIGCEDGPPVDPDYCVGMGFRESLVEAERIMRECIRPAMDAARRCGILVCHVESATIARLRPEAQEDMDVAAPAEVNMQPAVLIDPAGEIVVRSKRHQEDFICADVDLTLTGAKHGKSGDCCTAFGSSGRSCSKWLGGKPLHNEPGHSRKGDLV